jgi:hypothetical protein
MPTGGLIFGIFSHLTEVVGVLLALVICTTAQGFGGPYIPGSTDIGAALIYVLVFVALFLSSAGLFNPHPARTAWLCHLERYNGPFAQKEEMHSSPCWINPHSTLTHNVLTC